MRTLIYQREVRALPLLLALQAAGVPVIQVKPWPGRAEVHVEDYLDERDVATDAACAAVVAAHDMAAIDAMAARAEDDYLADRDLAHQAIAALLEEAAQLEQPLPALTLVTVRQHLQDTRQATARLNKRLAVTLRLLRRRDVI